MSSNSPNIYILSADKKSGKTSALQDWVFLQKRKNPNLRINGILEIDDNNVRYLLSLYNGEKKQLSISADHIKNYREQDIVCSYHYLQCVFEWANQTLLDSYNSDIVIVDELGPLELEDKGLAKGFKGLLSNSNALATIIIVVRPSSINSIIEFFKLNSPIVIDKEDLLKL